MLLPYCPLVKEGKVKFAFSNFFFFFLQEIMKESFWGFNRAAKVNLQADQNFLLFCFCWIFLKQRLTCCSFRFIFIFTFLSFSTFSVLTVKTWNNNLAYCLRDKSGEQYYWAQNIHDEKRINIAFWQHTLMKAFENHNSCRLKKKKKVLLQILC